MVHKPGDNQNVRYEKSRKYLTRFRKLLRDQEVLEGIGSKDICTEHLIMNMRQQHKRSNAEIDKSCDVEDLSAMESPHRPRTYSHLSELSVALSHSDLVENVPAMDTKMSDHPPDGGYGWCIVLATGFCNFVFIHSRICYGLFIPELTEYFGRSQTDMSLVASTDSIIRCVSCEYT